MTFLNNIRNYIEGTYYHLLHQWDQEPPHIKEQALLRMELCEPCLINGSCLRCGCSTPAMFYSPNKEDSDRKWGPMLSPEL